MIDRTSVSAWLGRYVDAWKSYDTAAIGDLFSIDASYSYHPFDEPIYGRAAIVASWIEPDRRDKTGTYSGEYRPIAIDGDMAVANGRSRYFEDDGKTLKREFDNIFVLRFDEQGRCREFREWYMERRKP